MTATPARQPQYFRVPDDTVYLLLGILRLEADGVKNPKSNIETAMKELKACASHTSPPAPRPPCEECMYQERIDKAAKDAREQVLDEPHIDQYLIRIRKASKALKEESLRNIISTSLLIAAEHYEAMREKHG
jgi:hypothetical protein